VRAPAPSLDAADPLVRVGSFLLLAVLPLLLAATFLVSGGPAHGFDFRQFLQGGRDVLHGVSPYPDPAALPDGAAARSLDPDAVQRVFRFPYPAPTALALVPFALLPTPVATWLFLLLGVASVVGALLLLGVRDWRCHGAAFLAVPVLGSIRLGTLTPLLLLGIAAAWRFRDRPRAVATLVAVVVVAKLFLWPLLLWLAATRRLGSACGAAALALVLTLAGWAVLGFEGLTAYPELVRRLASAVAWKSYSAAALADALGLPAGVGALGSGILGAALLVAALVAGRRGDELSALVAALLAALVLTPIVWLHYFALALVPTAIASRTLSAAWLIPVAFWIVPYQEADGEIRTIGTGLAVVCLTLLAAVRRSREPVPEGASPGGGALLAPLES
jgi:hypothetical protein